MCGVRGHDKIWGNEPADKHAGEGADIKDEDHIHVPRPYDWGFEEFRRGFPHRFACGQMMALRLFMRESGQGSSAPKPSLDATRREVDGMPSVGAERKKEAQPIGR